MIFHWQHAPQAPAFDPKQLHLEYQANGRNLRRSASSGKPAHLHLKPMPLGDLPSMRGTGSLTVTKTPIFMSSANIWNGCKANAAARARTMMGGHSRIFLIGNFDPYGC